MEADISTWRKTGHFYFALTQHDTTTNHPTQCVLHEISGGIRKCTFSDNGIELVVTSKRKPEATPSYSITPMGGPAHA